MKKARGTSKGQLFLDYGYLEFVGSEGQNKFISFDNIREVIMRRESMQPRAAEVFSSDGKSWLFVFHNIQSCGRFLKELNA